MAEAQMRVANWCGLTEVRVCIGFGLTRNQEETV